jgi:branched-chain amino acid transport system substrate-binding protein
VPRPTWVAWSRGPVRFGVAASLTAVLLLGAACGGGAAPAATMPAGAGGATRAAAKASYPIYTILPLTGPVALLGKDEQRAIQIYQKRLNAKGGISGRPVNFVFEDGQSSPTVSVQLAQQIIGKHVPVFLGPSLAASCNAVSALVPDGPVQWCLSPAVYPKPNSFEFATGWCVCDIIHGTMRYFKRRGWTRIGVIATNDATGQDGINQLKAVLKLPDMKGIRIVDTERFSVSSVSVVAQMERIKAARPQALFAWTTGSALSTVYKGMKAVGMNLPLTTSMGNQLYSLMDQLNSFAPHGAYLVSGQYNMVKLLPPGPAKTAAQNFLNAFRAAGTKADSGALPWDAVHLVVQALRKLGTGATPIQIRDYIQGIKNYAGVLGPYNFSASNHRGLSLPDVFVVRWSRAHRDWVPVSGPGGMPLSSQA